MNKLKYRFLIAMQLATMLLVGMPFISHAQVELQKIAPLSPNAASLLRFTETNISPYTGAAGISIPIYSLSSGSLKLDLSLGYSSTGNKITDVASWVGLGWNLSSIPMVTRSIRGLPDESSVGISVPYEGIYKIDKIIEISSTPGHPSGKTGNIICEIANGNIDTEPDYFHYTLLDNRSGFFYWDPFRESYQTYPYRDLKIKRIGNGTIDQIEITDDFGNLYLFSDWETSQSSGAYAGPTERNSWYVSKIYNSNRTDSISFGYSQETTYTRTLNPMKKEFLGTCPDNSSVMSLTTQHLKLPYTIQFAGGTVTFNRYETNREDLDGAKALKNIEITDKNNNLVKRFKFYFNYTTGTSADPLCQLISSLSHEKKRMFLKSVAEFGTSLTDSLEYAFEYETSIATPCRVSSAQDFWGYYNGQTQNADLVPEAPKGLVVSATVPGANRFVNTSMNQFGILKKIYYPTGGYAEYEYETHQVSDPTGELPAVYITKGVYLTPDNETSPNTFIDTINIYSGQDKFINNSPDGGSFLDVVLGDKNCVSDPPPAPGCRQFFIRGIDAWNTDVNLAITNNINLYHLKKGRYEIKAVFAQAPVIEQGFFMYFKWREVDTTFRNKYAGGLRVKETRISDNQGNQYKKKYVYNKSLISDSSSGLLISGAGFFRTQLTSCQDNQPVYLVADNSATITSQGGSYAGYSTVFEFIDTLQGFTQYQYSQARDYASNAMPFIPPIDRSEFRGQLINKKIFAKIPTGFKLQSEERNYYDYLYMDSVTFTALKTFKTMAAACQDNTPQGQLYVSETYSYTPVTSRLLKQQSVTFHQHNADSLVNQQEFFYKGFTSLVEKIKTTSSTNQVKEEFIYYASDSANSGNVAAVWDTMISRHMVAIPLKKVSKTGGNITATLINKYAQSSSLVQLQEIWHSFQNYTPAAEVFFNYSSNDKVIEQQKVNNVKEVYLWGYNAQYPVARILNSTYATASGYINQSILNNPSSDQALRDHLAVLRTIPGALVTTYTFKPLVGVTSETDINGKTIYYEYDTRGRLLRVRDQDNYILKQYDYRYRAVAHNNPIWQTTGNLRCKPCAANASYTSNVQQQEEKDTNPNSATYDQTRWTDVGVSSSCVVTADWQNTATAIRCKLSAGANTGEQEREQEDKNPCSSTYGQKRWIVTGTNTTACPLPVSIYAKLTYENYNYSYTDAVHADVVVRFYSNAACTIPATVSNLVLNYSIEGFNGSTSFSNDYSMTVSGSSVILAANAELSYESGSTFRFKDFYIVEGTGYIVVFE